MKFERRGLSVFCGLCVNQFLFHAELAENAEAWIQPFNCLEVFFTLFIKFEISNLKFERRALSVFCGLCVNQFLFHAELAKNREV